MNKSSLNDLASRVAIRVNHTNGGDGLVNYANIEVDRYDGSLISVVQAVLAEVDLSARLDAAELCRVHPAQDCPAIPEMCGNPRCTCCVRRSLGPSYA